MDVAWRFKAVGAVWDCLTGQLQKHVVVGVGDVAANGDAEPQIRADEANRNGYLRPELGQWHLKVIVTHRIFIDTSLDVGHVVCTPEMYWTSVIMR